MPINVPAVSPQEAKHIIEMLEPLKVSVMLWGPAGVGKSEVVGQIARSRTGKNGKPGRLIDLRLSHKIASDIGGLPLIDHASKTTTFAKPAWFPTDENETSILFLDELAGADAHTRIASYGLLLERRIDEWILPDSCQVVAASNRTEDGAISAEFGAALNDRLVHLVVEPEINDWISWATEHDVEPSIVAFLRSSPHRLYAKEQEINSGDAVLPSPRSWKRASDALKLMKDENFSSKIRTATIAGIIGQGVSFEFWAVYDEVFSLPPIEEILAAAREGSIRLYELMPKTLNGLFCLGFGLASVINEKNTEAVMRVVLALQESTTGLSVAEGMSFVGTLVSEAAERRHLDERMMLSSSFNRYVTIMKQLENKDDKDNAA